jgi:hypothetical protein
MSAQTATVPTIFAALFLTSPPGLQVEPGCYDAELQLYVSSKTGRPAYVGLSASERTQLADTTGSRCSISTMTGQRSSPDDHSDSVQDDFD